MKKFDRCLLPAIPTWFKKADGGVEIALSLNKKYVSGLLDENIDGIASFVHTGRGNFLNVEEMEFLLGEFVDICHDREKIIVTGVRNGEEARLAKNIGIDMVLAFPNREEITGLDKESRKRKVIEHHEQIASAHGMSCIFYLYEETGIGIHYTREELIELCSLDGVEAIKFALLSNFEVYEDFFTLIQEEVPELTIFSGEDRMFAESIEKCRDLMLCGDDKYKGKCNINALVGLGCVLPFLQKFMLQAFDKVEMQEDYHRARALIANLARNSFVRPMDDAGNYNYFLPMEPYIANIGIGTAYQFDIPSNAIPDIALVKEEHETRRIPKKLLNHLEITRRVITPKK